MAVGAAFVLGPVFLGKDWIMRVLWLSAALCGAVGTSLMLEGWGAGYASFVVKTASLDEDGECIFAIINIILGALVAASFATKVVGLAIFGVGAIAAGYASNIAVPTYVVPFVKEQYPEMVLQDWYTYAAVGILALIGGYVFTALAFAVVDVVLGLIGAYLIADGTLELIVANELVPPDVEESIQLEDNLRYYVLALAALIFFVRSRLVEKPRGGRVGTQSSSVGDKDRTTGVPPGSTHDLILMGTLGVAARDGGLGCSCMSNAGFSRATMSDADALDRGVWGLAPGGRPDLVPIFAGCDVRVACLARATSGCDAVRASAARSGGAGGDDETVVYLVSGIARSDPRGVGRRVVRSS